MLATMHDILAPALVRLGAAFGAVLLAASIALAQQPGNVSPPQLQAPSQAQPPPAEAPPPAPRTTLPTPPEVISAIGRFIDQSIANVGAGVKGAGETFGGASSAAGELARGVGSAAGAVARLPLSNVVAGRETCPPAANGAPDCAAASLALCRAKGFERGASLDITSARKCPAAVWLEGRQPTDAECTNESFVSRAICQ
jgi:hypothetical protein